MPSAASLLRLRACALNCYLAILTFLPGRRTFRTEAFGSLSTQEGRVVVAHVRSLAEGMEPVPGYFLRRLLGRGGWGTVWQATRPDGTASALKFLPGESPRAAPQEIRALQAIRQLQHPNLIHIEQIWSISGYVV